MTKVLSRRMLLRTVGGAALALPLLSDIPRRFASAQNAAFPKRFIVVFTPNGTIPSAWKSTGSGATFQPGTILAQPLAAHKNDIIVVQNLDMTAALHGPGGDAHGLGLGCLLTATELLAGEDFKAGMGGAGSSWPGGISIDQYIANKIGTKTQFPSLEFAVKRMQGSIWSRMSYRGPSLPVTPMDNPSVAFDRIFGNLDSSPTMLASQRSRRKSILDAVTGQYASLSGSLSGADKRKVDSHLAALRDLENRVTMAPMEAAVACARPARPALVESAPIVFNDTGMEMVNPAQDVDVPERNAVLRSMVVSALACDLTRVASLMLAPSRSDIVLNWIGIPDSHHDLSHQGDSNTDAQNKLVKINQWYAGQVAELIAALKAVPEGAGTLFDNTVILWCNELGVGNAHSHTNIPLMLAGSAGGYFKTGQALSFPNGTAHNGLFISLCNAMGLPDTTFGNPMYCNGPLPGLAA